METVVASVGGSFLVGEDGVNVTLARGLADTIGRVTRSRRVLVVVGGGVTARRYIDAARALGSEEASLDDLGIAVTRVNARVLIAALHDPYPVPATTLDEAVLAARSYPVVVLGGTHPGHTTDAVAAMLAERTRATRLVVATNVDGVYEKDPRHHPDAKRIPRLTSRELVALTTGSDRRAGGSGVVDGLGAQLIARSGIETAIVNGRDGKALEAALAGAPDFDGSLIAGE